MLDKNPHPTDAQIRESMNNTLCRCMTYYRVQAAIKRAAKTMAEARPLRTRRWSHELRQYPKQIEDVLSLHRRGFLKTRACCVASAFARRRRAARLPPTSPGPYPDVDFQQLDSWIVIHEDNTATFYVGKTDPGQGTGTGFPPVDVRRTRYRVRQDHLHHGEHGHHRRPGRRPADRARWNGTRGRCAARPRKRAGCCWKWRPPASECRWINSPSATA